ncbi:MAG: response regulator [Proteobacteria bacterium]|nr:response regulator [Desulfobacula sp.]MBU4130291.1 response regulator [Pseudomonadota bacterium]
MNQDTILVVDDEKAILHMFSLAFSKKGYRVRSAENAEEALNILKTEKIHVMFLDLDLPGMNGIELCRAIRKDMPMAILYALTGYASLFELSDCRDAGFDDYYKKPVSMSVLLESAKAGFEKIERWRNV